MPPGCALRVREGRGIAAKRRGGGLAAVVLGAGAGAARRGCVARSAAMGLRCLRASSGRGKQHLQCPAAGLCCAGLCCAVCGAVLCAGLCCAGLCCAVRGCAALCAEQSRAGRRDASRVRKKERERERAWARRCAFLCVLRALFVDWLAGLCPRAASFSFGHEPGLSLSLSLEKVAAHTSDAKGPHTGRAACSESPIAATVLSSPHSCSTIIPRYY